MALRRRKVADVKWSFFSADLAEPPALSGWAWIIQDSCWKHHRVGPDGVAFADGFGVPSQQAQLPCSGDRQIEGNGGFRRTEKLGAENFLPFRLDREIRPAIRTVRVQANRGGEPVVNAANQVGDVAVHVGEQAFGKILRSEAERFAVPRAVMDNLTEAGERTRGHGVAQLTRTRFAEAQRHGVGIGRLAACERLGPHGVGLFDAGEQQGKFDQWVIGEGDRQPIGIDPVTIRARHGIPCQADTGRLKHRRRVAKRPPQRGCDRRRLRRENRRIPPTAEIQRGGAVVHNEGQPDVTGIAQFTRHPAVSHKNKRASGRTRHGEDRGGLGMVRVDGARTGERIAEIFPRAERMRSTGEQGVIRIPKGAAGAEQVVVSVVFERRGSFANLIDDDAVPSDAELLGTEEVGEVGRELGGV